LCENHEKTEKKCGENKVSHAALFNETYPPKIVTLEGLAVFFLRIEAYLDFIGKFVS
jgi:hypothetical protein